MSRAQEMARLAQAAANYATLAAIIHFTTTTGVEQVRHGAQRNREAGNEEMAARLDAEVERMREDPVGTHYGRDEHGRVKAPIGWPSDVAATEWNPSNNPVNNLVMARELIDAAIDTLRAVDS